MAGICKIRGKERGLRFEIKALEEIIARNTAPQKDLDYAKVLLKSYQKFSEKDYAARVLQEVK